MTWTYLARRLLLAVVSFFGVLVCTFVLSQVVPGDPAVVAAGRVPDPAVVARIRGEMGLDKPLHEQLGIYISRVLFRLDLGRSVVTKRPVIQDLKRYFPATIELVTVSLLFITVIGLWVGVLSATKRNSPIDHAIRAITLSGISMPEFWLAIMLQLLFARSLRVLPVDGRVAISVLIGSPLNDGTGFYVLDSLLQGNWRFLGSSMLHLVLPVFTLTFSLVAYVVRMARAAMLDVLGQDYIRTATAIGLGRRKVIYKHALRNALIPILTVIGMVYGFLLGGTVLVELIFSWPGIGRYAADAVFTMDAPAIMGVTILASMIIISLNLIVDMLCAFVNPAVRYT